MRHSGYIHGWGIHIHCGVDVGVHAGHVHANFSGPYSGYNYRLYRKAINGIHPSSWKLSSSQSY